MLKHWYESVWYPSEIGGALAAFVGSHPTATLVSHCVFPFQNRFAVSIIYMEKEPYHGREPEIERR